MSSEPTSAFSTRINVVMLIVALCSAIFAILSWKEANNQNMRYYDEIKFYGLWDLDTDTLAVHQASGSPYFLETVILMPTYLSDKGLKLEEGLPYILDLIGTKNKNDVYVVKKISKELCKIQNIENCIQRRISVLYMKYTINDEERDPTRVRLKLKRDV